MKFDFENFLLFFTEKKSLAFTAWHTFPVEKFINNILDKNVNHCSSLQKDNFLSKKNHLIFYELTKLREVGHKHFHGIFGSTPIW